MRIIFPLLFTTLALLDALLFFVAQGFPLQQACAVIEGAVGVFGLWLTTRR